MRSDIKPNFKNRPPHFFNEGGYYFITARTVEGKYFLKPEEYKKILLETIHEKCRKFNFPLIAFAILHNHYHIIVNIKLIDRAPSFIREINGTSAKRINDADRAVARKIWWNYFETFLRDENDFFVHLNYIHQNPVKHGVGEIFGYEFSSYEQWIKKKGKEYLDHSFEKYPVIDFMAVGDDF